MKPAKGASAPTATNVLIDAAMEAFGLHPEDVISPINSAAEVCDWLEEIFVSIRLEAAGCGDTARIKHLANAGSYLASDMGDFYEGRHEEMFGHLKAAGIVADQKAGGVA